MSSRCKVAFACALLFFIVFFIYFHTQAPSVQFIDSGELAVVCKSLGLAHPTGYPLYVLLGRLFCLLPLKDIIFRVNLMSLLLTCLANTIVFFILLTIGKNFSRGEKGDSNILIWSAFVASLIFSFTPTLWSQATSNEVYSLNILLYTVIVLLVLLWQNTKEKRGSERLFYLFTFIYALSFGNHMSTILLLPSLLFILIATHGSILYNWKRASLILALFLLGLSIYLFLPVRSSQNPLMDWGNPESWSTFKRHVTGWQYQVWMFAQSAQELSRNIRNFIELFFHQFPLYLLPLSFLGIFWLFVHERKSLFFLLILFFANILYGVNYAIPDIDPYFLGSFMVNAIFLGTGLHSLFQTIKKLRIKKLFSYGFLLSFILLPLILLKKSYLENDRSQNFFAYDFVSNVMRSVKKDAIILTNIWDHYSPWLYLRYVELKRPDVNFLDIELCRRSWYFDYVKQNCGDLYRKSEAEIKRFIQDVYPFENRQPYDPQVIEEAYENMLNSFLSYNFRYKPLYDDMMGKGKIGQIYFRIPEGLVFSLEDSLKYYPYDFPDFQLRGILDKNVYRDDRTLFHLKRYPLMIDLRIRYLLSFKKDKEADALLRRYEALLSKATQ